MPYALALLAALLVIPAVGLGLIALSLAIAAAVLVFACALALGATGSFLDWVLALSAVGLTWPAVQSWRRLVRRVKAALATAAPGIGRPRGG